ncbi:YbfB/YjiJ family MFS transporter [Roseovarius sp.]|uniref:YbfB/YjiJ family MFS transporter n=1 Tax=Roseovarius sp. TaxID=1486281 RepID=UPI0035626C4B
MTPGRDWWIVIGLALGVTISNAFARFAYGLILPAMQSDLDWTYTQSGWINTANALGYIGGAVLTFAAIGRVPAKWLFSVGLVVTSISLLMCGFGDGFWYLTFWRILAGVAGAPVFIAGGTMAASLFPDDAKRNALAIAGYFGGAGLGMILSGAVLPGLFARLGTLFWPEAWIGLGAASLILAPFSIWAAGQTEVSQSTSQADVALPVAKMGFALLGYGLFATGYIVYLTFIVASVREDGLSAATISGGWVIIGIGIILSPFLWRPVLARWASGVPLALACAVTGIATLLPWVVPGVLGFALSALLFGLAVFIGPGAVTNFGRKNLPQALWGKSVSLFTLIFAIGQTVGPVAAGVIADMTGTVDAGVIVAGGILLCAAALAAFQRPVARA